MCMCVRACGASVRVSIVWWRSSSVIIARARVYTNIKNNTVTCNMQHTYVRAWNEATAAVSI